jgi:hypothetical protein
MLSSKWMMEKIKYLSYHAEHSPLMKPSVVYCLRHLARRKIVVILELPFQVAAFGFILFVCVRQHLVQTVIAGKILQETGKRQTVHWKTLKHNSPK